MARLPYSRRKAQDHLTRVDPVMAGLVARIGRLGIEARSFQSPFHSLLRAIAYQSVSTKAAATIYGRVETLLGGAEAVAPRTVLSVPDQALRDAGLSWAKVASMKDLAEKTQAGLLPDAEVARGLADEEIIERLTTVRGIGRWTVEMLLMFQMGRPDVLPVGDLGVRNGYTKAYGREERITPKALAEAGEVWRPYRSAAAWYLWRCLDQPAAIA